MSIYRLQTPMAPLADRMRPHTLDDVLGQSEVIGADSALRKAVSAGHLPSLILWGPPGSGKTTIARILAQDAHAEFHSISAVSSGVSDLRRIIAKAKENKTRGVLTVIFLDEIHRWNKAQQDGLLPYIENGLLVLIGATTENPSFEVNSALLSRCRVYVLRGLFLEELVCVLESALVDDDRGLGAKIILIAKENLEIIAQLSGGDARVALNILEAAVSSSAEKDGQISVSQKTICSIAQKTHLIYDKKADEHYNVISAFIKSIRGSAPSAAVYWLARMIEGGEDPEFIARRLLILASEDIGNALPTALVVANACFDAVRKIGWPESQLILSQTVMYLARAPKSNSAKRAISVARAEVQKSGALPVPLHLRNASTSLMKELGYGKKYIYTHDDPSAKQEFLPDQLVGREFI